MAKSIRSKWKRKCRAIKRQRYAVKELARLKKMLGLPDESKTTTDKNSMEGTEGPSDQVVFLDAGEVQKDIKSKKKDADPESDVEMSTDDENIEIDGAKGKRVFSRKTLKDQNGQYPVWLHKRKIAKLNKTVKKRHTKKKIKKRKIK